MGNHHTEGLRSHEGAPELRVSEQKATKPKKVKWKFSSSPEVEDLRNSWVWLGLRQGVPGIQVTPNKKSALLIATGLTGKGVHFDTKIAQDFSSGELGFQFDSGTN